MEAEDKSKKIESYLDGSLSGNEREDFEKELSKDPDLEKEVELHRLIHKAIRIKGRSQLKSELNEIYEKEITGKKNLRIVWTIISIAASITILFFIFRGNDNNYFRNDEEITLDSARINTINNYADSAIFDSLSNGNVKLKK